MPKIIYILGLLFLAVLTGCDKNPTGSGPDNASGAAADTLSTVIVIFEDQKKDSYVTIPDYYGNADYYRNVPDGAISNGRYGEDDLFFKSYAFINNTAVVDSVPPGNYSIGYTHYEYDIFTKLSLTIYFTNTFEAKDGKTVETRFIVPKEIESQLIVESYSTLNGPRVPIKGAEISSDPITVTATTNDEGMVFLGIQPVVRYDFTLKKYNFIYSGNYTSLNIYNNEYGEYRFFLTNYDLQPPITEIISPPDNHYQNNTGIHLVGDGYDFEDDVLPDSSFTWYSDIDGELGKGRDLIIPRLNIGNHTISLVGTDSHNIKGESSIQLNLSFFDGGSYFPLPYSGYWYYRYETADFTVTDNVLGDEQWSLNDLKVSADDANTRSSLLEYTITRGDSTKYCRYEVVDHYETDTDNIYIAKTTERMQIFEDESMITDPVEQLDIETVYSPRYLLMKQFMDPAAGTAYEASCTAEVTWEYRNDKSYTQSHVETTEIGTSYETGEPESIETDIGTYNAVPLKILSDGTERIWWLAKGIGIVRLAYDSFDFPLTATLSDTNVKSFHGFGPSEAASKSSFPGNNNNRIAFDSLPETPERMMELSKILRGLCLR